MKRNKFSLRKPSSKVVKPLDSLEVQIEGFTKHIYELFASGIYSPEYTINIDETGICTESNNSKTVDIVGTKHIRVKSSNKEKDSTTVMLGGSMCGEKIKPTIVLKGSGRT